MRKPSILLWPADRPRPQSVFPDEAIQAPKIVLLVCTLVAVDRVARRTTLRPKLWTAVVTASCRQARKKVVNLVPLPKE